ncbi:Retrovirus-related Pol polyprotein from transposon 17.6 [Araneus ventricosus]|uniref:Retrovirus-related Pol polyprotein from transposon 17.6 n=1 Tax=Araneus ventricosus TaxID=182803 RepID=A0A4Y2R4K1_ARAVE|nr:Retrovirus-related Pol polyprotein from transposon 17.6 [Araneus ventricosus]
MIKFYHKFLKDADKVKSFLNDLTKRKSKSDKTPLFWTENEETAFKKVKKEIADASLLAHPLPDAKLSLVVDASDFVSGAVLQQSVIQDNQPLFFSRKLNNSGQKYSTYDRKLLAIYTVIKHFRYMVEGRNFVVYTDNKLLIYAYRQKGDKCSPLQIRNLEFISQYTTDLRHVAGEQSLVADSFSRILAIDLTHMGDINYEDMASARRVIKNFTLCFNQIAVLI